MFRGRTGGGTDGRVEREKKRKSGVRRHEVLPADDCAPLDGQSPTEGLSPALVAKGSVRTMGSVGEGISANISHTPVVCVDESQR